MTLIVHFLGILIMLCHALSLSTLTRGMEWLILAKLWVGHALSKYPLHGHLILIQPEAPLINSGKVRVKMVRSGVPCLTYFSYLPHCYKSYFSPTFSTCLHRRHLLCACGTLAPPSNMLAPSILCYARFANFKLYCLRSSSKIVSLSNRKHRCSWPCSLFLDPPQ